MVYKQKLSKIGNSVGLTLPKSIRDKLDFKLGQDVYVQEDPRTKNVVISVMPVQDIEFQISPEFYSLLKSVSTKYSKALEKLAVS